MTPHHPHHHLDDSTLLSFAGGSLDEAFSVVVASHLAMCGQCRAALQEANEVGGHLLEDVVSEPLAADALQGVLARLDEPSPVYAAPAREQTQTAGDVPMPLRSYIGARLDAIRWSRVAPGVKLHRIGLTTSTPSKLYMLNIEAGRAVPEHGHGGAEITLVLSGAYRDALGRFGPGDLSDLDEHIEHQPKVEPGGPCICIVATETQTRFRGFFSRLLQPLIGI